MESKKKSMKNININLITGKLILILKIHQSNKNIKLESYYHKQKHFMLNSFPF